MTNDDLIAIATDLRDEVREVRGELKGVKGELSKSKEVIRKLRRLAWWMISLFVLFVLASSYFINENKQADYQGCLNANESREFQYRAWLYVLGQELTDHSKQQNSIEEMMAEAILPAMKQGWRPRDCDDLDKPYKIDMPPTPPGIPDELKWGR